MGEYLSGLGSAVVAEWISLVLLAVLAVIWTALYKRFAKKRWAILYVVLGTAASVYLLQRAANLVEQQPSTIEQRVNAWLNDLGYSVEPLSLPADSPEVFHTNVMIPPDTTLNIAIPKDRPDFIRLSIPSPLSVAQTTWWKARTARERDDVLFSIQSEVGLDPDVGFTIDDASTNGGETWTLLVVRQVPIDESLTKAWFFREMEVVGRYRRVLAIALNRHYEAASK